MRCWLFLLVVLSGCHIQPSDRSRARESAVRVQVQGFAEALEAYRADTGEYPTAEQGLAALRHRPQSVNGWQGPYLPKDIPKDPWGRPYIYRAPTSPGERPEVTSLGRPD